MSFDPQSPSDRADNEPDDARFVTDKLHVVSGSPLSTPFPRDRLFWIVTDDGLAVEVAYSHEHMLWTRRETYIRQDGESGAWEPDEIMGWTDSYQDAEEAAEMVREMAL